MWKLSYRQSVAACYATFVYCCTLERTSFSFTMAWTEDNATRLECGGGFQCLVKCLLPTLCPVLPLSCQNSASEREKSCRGAPSFISSSRMWLSSSKTLQEYGWYMWENRVSLHTVTFKSAVWDAVKPPKALCIYFFLLSIVLVCNCDVGFNCRWTRAHLLLWSRKPAHQSAELCGIQNALCSKYCL